MKYLTFHDFLRTLRTMRGNEDDNTNNTTTTTTTTITTTDDVCYSLSRDDITDTDINETITLLQNNNNNNSIWDRNSRRTPTTISTVRFIGPKSSTITPPVWEHFIQTIVYHPSIQHIGLEKNLLCPLTINILATIFRTTSIISSNNNNNNNNTNNNTTNNIQRLDVAGNYNCGLRLDDIIVLLNSLQSNHTIEYLDLRNTVRSCIISDTDRIRLATTSHSLLQQQNTTLQYLELSNNQLGDYITIQIANALQSNTTLVSLKYNGNKVQDGGAIALAHMLQYHNSTLRTLLLDRNEISEVGAIALAAALRNQSPLLLSVTTVLSSPIFSAPAPTLAAAAAPAAPAVALQSSSTTVATAALLPPPSSSSSSKSVCQLHDLSLSLNAITPIGLHAIGMALVNNNTLRHLSISHNRYCTIFDTIPCIDALKYNTSLRTLDIYQSKQVVVSLLNNQQQQQQHRNPQDFIQQTIRTMLEWNDTITSIRVGNSSSSSTDTSSSWAYSRFNREEYYNLFVQNANGTRIAPQKIILQRSIIYNWLLRTIHTTTTTPTTTTTNTNVEPTRSQQEQDQQEEQQNNQQQQQQEVPQEDQQYQLTTTTTNSTAASIIRRNTLDAVVQVVVVDEEVEEEPLDQQQTNRTTKRQRSTDDSCGPDDNHNNNNINYDNNVHDKKDNNDGEEDNLITKLRTTTTTNGTTTTTTTNGTTTKRCKK